MPVNFTPYIPQATDLLTPAMNMVKLKQDQEQMGLLRDYKTMQMQQMQMQQEQAQQEQAFKKMQIGKTKADIHLKMKNYAGLKQVLKEDFGFNTDNIMIPEEEFMKQATITSKAVGDWMGNRNDPVRKAAAEAALLSFRTNFPEAQEDISKMYGTQEKQFRPERKISEIGGQGFEVQPGAEPGTQLLPVTPEAKNKTNLQYVGVSNDKDKAPVVFDPDSGGTFKNINGKLMPYSGQVEPKIERQTTTVITPGQTATVAHGIRTEMRSNPVIKDFQDLVQKHNGMEEAYKASKTTKNFVAVDQALITFFNKATDPSSVVRESEYARTPENLSLVNRIKGKANKILEGGAGLTSDERTALRDMMQSFYRIYEKEYKFTVNNYKRMAKESGINPDLVSIPYETRPQEEPQSNKPTLQQWLPEARKANPNETEQGLINYYNKKYGDK